MLYRYGSDWLSAHRALGGTEGYFRTPMNGRHGIDRWETTLTGAGTMRSIAANKLSKKLNNRDIDLGVALGEARETAHFIQGAMLSAFVAAKRARRGDLSGVLNALGLSSSPDPRLQRFRDVPDKIAGAWLGYSFGVRPLLADVFGACKALEKRHERPFVKSYRSSHTEEISVLLNSSVNEAANWPGYDPDIRILFKGWHRAHRKVSFEIENEFLYTLSGLGLTNPLATAYQLMTLSFVLDWFIPIGDWVNGIVPPQGITNVRGTSTWYGRCEVEGALRHSPLNWPLKGKIQETPFKAKEVWKERVQAHAIPTFSLVGADFTLSKEQVMSGISLLWTFGAGRKSEAKAWNDAIDLRSRAYSMLSGGPTSREKSKGSPWPRDYDAL